MSDDVVHLPRVADDDSIWLRWLETKAGDEIEIFIDDDDAEDIMTPEQHIEWMRRLSPLVSQLSVIAKQRIRKISFSCFVELRPEITVAMNDALCALVTLFHKHLESLSFDVDVQSFFESFQSLPTMRNVRTLNFCAARCTNQGKYIAHVMQKCSNITELDLSNCDLNDDDFAFIASVPCSLLEVLDVSFNFCQSRGMQSVAQMLRDCKNIRSVEIISNDNELFVAKHDVAEIFASLSDKPHLERLSYFSQITADDLEGDYLQQMVNMKDLALSLPTSSAVTERAFSNVRAMQGLTTLFLEFNNGLELDMDRMLSELLGSLNCLSSLTVITFAKTGNLFKHVAEHIASTNCRIKELKVFVPVEGDAWPILTALQFNRSLKSVELSVKISDEAFAKALGKVLRESRMLRRFSCRPGWPIQHWTTVVNELRYSAIEYLDIAIYSSKGATDEAHRLLEDVAKQGYLVQCSRPLVLSDECSQRMALNKKRHIAAKLAAFVLLAVRRYRKSALNALQYDIIKIIAIALFETRCTDAWSNALA